MSDKQPGEKMYGLKPIEEQMLQVMQQQHNVLISNFLSFIALERLAYQVTEQTRFRVEDGTLYISENTPEPAPEVSTGSDTKEAIAK